MENSNINHEKLCRTCKCQSENLKSIFEEHDFFRKQKIADVLMACASVQVRRGDGLPNSMCVACISELQFAYSFQIKCQNTDMYFRTHMQPSNTKNGLIIEVKKENASENENYFLSLSQLKASINYNSNVNTIVKPRRMFTCEICNKSLSRLEHLKRHMMIHLKSKPYICGKCKRGFNNEESLINHEEKCQGQPPCVCPICNRSFDSEDILNGHMNVHNRGMMNQFYVDNLNNDETVQRSVLYKNLLEPEIDISEKFYDENNRDDSSTSDQMDMDVKREDESDALIDENLLIPQINMTEEGYNDEDENYDMEDGDCNEGEKFLTSYIKEEPTENNFPCKDCDQSFNTMVDLQIHKLNHSKVEQYFCEICSKGFTRNDHLKRHMISHLELKPFNCDVCAKQFARKDHLNKHLKLHMPGQKYECEVCQEVFLKKDHLSKHFSLKHRGVDRPHKKFKCDLCNKGFTTKSYRDVHYNAHLSKVRTSGVGGGVKDVKIEPDS